MEDKTNLIGRLIMGFQYASSPGRNYFVPQMRQYIGKVGIVVEEDEIAIRVKFSDDTKWWYPKADAMQHIGGEVIEPEIDIKELINNIQNHGKIRMDR